MNNPNLNPYAAPIASLVPEHVGDSDGVWRDVDLLVVRKGSILPDRCVKCNAPADGSRKQLTLYWHNPWIYILIIVQILIYILVSLIVRHKIELSTGVCRRHLARRRWAILFAWLLFFAGIGIAILGGSLMDSRQARGFGAPLIFAACATMLGAAIFGVIASRLLWAKRIDANFAWIKGACPEYLSDLPDLPSASNPSSLPR